MMKLDTRIVAAALAGMIGAHVSEPIGFTPKLSLHSELAASWMKLVANISHAADLLGHPLVAASFADSLARGLLLASRHPFSRQIEQAASLPRSAIVRAAGDYIEDNAHMALTVSEIASRCHVSTRTLQLAFQRHLGMSPMAYARRVRLRKVHDDLKVSDPRSVTVASVAHKWGFTHLGRLAAEYRSCYGRLPVETLRLSH